MVQWLYYFLETTTPINPNIAKIVDKIAINGIPVDFILAFTYSHMAYHFFKNKKLIIIVSILFKQTILIIKT